MFQLFSYLAPEIRILKSVSSSSDVKIGRFKKIAKLFFEINGLFKIETSHFYAKDLGSKINNFKQLNNLVIKPD